MLINPNDFANLLFGIHLSSAVNKTNDKQKYICFKLFFHLRTKKQLLAVSRTDMPLEQLVIQIYLSKNAFEARNHRLVVRAEDS
jgi:hypothetical protein